MWIGRLILMTLLALTPIPAVSASEADLTAARQVIADQLAAFARDDGAAAYAFAAPEIQAKFPSPEIFMAMVRQGYSPVYRQHSYGFAESEVEADGIIRQTVDIIAADGTAWTAEYRLRPGPDGRLRIIACRLVKAPGVGA
ncbi:MAG: DUF4864 domain-containing protein [Hyphomicrobiaceae bacterium]|jgi:hypothetical protein